jgi:hypothetical protein
VTIALAMTLRSNGRTTRLPLEKFLLNITLDNLINISVEYSSFYVVWEKAHYMVL